jgi:hypothetical protein
MAMLRDGHIIRSHQHPSLPTAEVLRRHHGLKEQACQNRPARKAKMLF